MRVLWRRSAIEDLDSAREYIQSLNPSVAARIIGRIEEATVRLVAMPFLGKPGRIEGTRELVVPRTPYRITYRLFDEHLEIIAVTHGARNIEQE